MKEFDLLPTLAPASAGGKAAGTASEMGFFYRRPYKFWVLAAILLLAACSMLAGTVTLNWSGNLNEISKNSISEDLDVLELEERGKVVRHLWDVYSDIRRIPLPRFWKNAFEAAYEELKSDNRKVRDAALAEIARMSLRMVDLVPPPRQTQDSEAKIHQSHTGFIARSLSSSSF